MAFLMCTEELTYKEIKQRILDGRLLPGTRIVHRAIAKEIGVSSVPVVLALRMLERDGLVTNTPGLGATVRGWNRDEIIDLYHIRASQEALAARLCAERASSLELDAVVAAAKAFTDSYNAKDTEANIQDDVAFHLAIVRGAHCADLQRLIENLSIMQCCMRAFAMSLHVPRFFAPTEEGVHAPLLDALLRRDGDAAEIEARKHVDGSLERNLRWINEVDAAVDHDPKWRLATAAR